MTHIQKMGKAEKALISFLLTTGQSCNLSDLAPLSDRDRTTNSRPVLYRMRKIFIRQGNLSAAQKLGSYLDIEMSDPEMKKIIKGCWKHHDVKTALEAISLISDSPSIGRAAIEDALQKCAKRALSEEHYFRPRYKEAVPKVMALATI